MFKIVICLVVLGSGVYGASIRSGLEEKPTTEKAEVVPLLTFISDRNPDGSFKFSYEGGDKSARQETGQVENAGTDDEALEVTGFYRYIDADGQEIEVHYTAGKNGFVPIGTNIPSEISDAAKAAADLPDYSYEQEQEEKLKRRRARAETGEKPEKKKVIETELKSEAKPELKAAASQVVPVKVLLVEEKKVEKQEKVDEKKSV